MNELDQSEGQTASANPYYEDCSHIVDPKVIQNSYFLERLIYGTEKGYIVIRELPFMNSLKRINISTSNIIQPVLTFMVSKDRRFLLVGCGEGGLTVITEPFSQQHQLNQANSRQTRNSMIQSNRGLNSSSGKLMEGQNSGQQQNPYTNVTSAFSGNSKLSKTSGGSIKNSNKL